jgi:predicted DNA-binding helix-hairpin-helix protein
MKLKITRSWSIVNFFPTGWTQEQIQAQAGIHNAWAERYLRAAPLEIMITRRDQLLHIPGIGLVAADAILTVR